MKTIRQYKRLAAIFIVFVMVLGMIPTVMAADEGNPDNGLPCAESSQVPAVPAALPAVTYSFDAESNCWIQETEHTIFVASTAASPDPAEVTMICVDLPEIAAVGSPIVDFLDDDPNQDYTITGNWWKLGADGVSTMHIENGKPVTPGAYQLVLCFTPRQGHAFAGEVSYNDETVSPNEDGNILITVPYKVQYVDVTVTFHLNGGLNGPSIVTMPYDEMLMLNSLPPVPHASVDGIPVVHLGWSTSRIPLLSHADRDGYDFYYNDDSVHMDQHKDLYAVFGLDENGNGIGDYVEEQIPTDIRIRFNGISLTGTPGADHSRDYHVKVPLNPTDERMRYDLSADFLDQFGDEIKRQYVAFETYTDNVHLRYDPTGRIVVYPGVVSGETLPIVFPNKEHMDSMGVTLPTHRITVEADGNTVFYQVYHMFEDWQSAPGTYVTKVQQKLCGTAGAETDAIPLGYRDYTVEPYTQTTIAADGSTELKIFYTRDRYELTWDFGPFTPSTDDYPHGLLPVGTEINPIPLNNADHVLFEGYNASFPVVMPGEDVVISASWSSDQHPHILRRVPSVAPSHSADGVKEYYICRKCGKSFENMNAETEIADLAIWKQGAGKLPMRHYTFLEGADSEWIDGSPEGLRFRVDGEYADFVGVSVDGMILEASSYTVAEGSTIVTLKAEYLDTLQHKDHTVSILFNDGSAETNFKVKQRPFDPNDPDHSRNPFNDVDENAYYYNAVLWATSEGITAGKSQTEFGPGDDCTRAQMIKFLWNAAGRPKAANRTNPFTDVSPDSYYYEAVLWAVENRITSGISKTEFAPGAACSRAQVVSFLWSANNRPEPKETQNPFDDVSQGSYYYRAVLWAVENNITSGIEKTEFGPDGICTRAQAVKFLWNDAGRPAI